MRISTDEHHLTSFVSFSPEGNQQIHHGKPDICYKTQLAVATLFLIGGICAASIGIPSLSRNIQDVTFEISGKVNVDDFSFAENITFVINKSDCYRDAIVSIGGLFSILLSTGMLLGLACQRIR